MHTARRLDMPTQTPTRLLDLAMPFEAKDFPFRIYRQAKLEKPQVSGSFSIEKVITNTQMDLPKAVFNQNMPVETA